MTRGPTIAHRTQGDPGALVIRPYRGAQDHAAMCRVANLVRAANGDPLIDGVEWMDHYYARFEPSDLEAGCALVQLDGTLVAYARAMPEEWSTGGSGVGGILAVEPGAAGRGIEELLVDHIVRRSASVVRAVGNTDPTRARLFVGSLLAEQRRALESAGFRKVRAGAHMIRPSLDDIPEIALPAGCDVRPIGPEDEPMHRRVWEAGGLAPSQIAMGRELLTERGYQAWRESPGFDPPLWRVALFGDELAGQILNYLGEPEPDSGRIGWTESISVQREFRRRGLARALLAASLRAVRDAVATKAALGVDSANPNEAQSLYEGMGYRVISATVPYELATGAPRVVGCVGRPDRRRRRSIVGLINAGCDGRHEAAPSHAATDVRRAFQSAAGRRGASR